MKFNPYQWYNYQRKRGMHEEAIKEALDRIEQYQPSNPWAYGVKVLSIINGNYNERDHVARHEEMKESREDFALAIGSDPSQDTQIRIIDLIKKIGGKNERNQSKQS